MRARLLFALAALALAGCGEELPRPVPLLLVVGVDGGERRVLETLWARNELPALRRLAEQGTIVPLATDFGISPVIWTTIATGVEPAEHGITDFVVSTERGDVPVSSAVRRRPALWNMLSRVRRPVAAIGWWATWPAESIEGLMVTDRAALGLGREIWPEQRAPELAAWLKGARAGGPAFGGNDASQLQDRIVTLAARSALGERHQLVLAYYRSVDLASHDFWHRFAPGDFAAGAPAGAADSDDPDPVRTAYRAVDEAIGSLLAATPGDPSVLIFSDHGFRAETGASLQLLLDFDRVLERLGWLVRAPDGTVDTSRSRAWVVDSPDYRAEKRIRFAPAGAESAAADLERDLARVRFAERPAFHLRRPNRRERRREIGLVATVDLAAATPVVAIDGRPVAGIVTHFGRITGGHDAKTAGILIASGPLFARGAVAEVSIRDIAPTVLHALGLPVADDFAGNVALDLLSPELRARTIRRIASWGTRESGEALASERDRELLEELGALGYLD